MLPLPDHNSWHSLTRNFSVPSKPSSSCSEVGLQHPARVDFLTKIDAFFIVFGSGLTLLLCVLLSHHRIFWEDEMLGWMLLWDPSWHHMIRAWKMGCDGGGFLFYLTGRLWFWIFGASEISFRLYSAVCFGLAFCVLWITLRRFYRTSNVTFALFNTWFFSQTIITHVAEGRFYGLLMLFTALLVWLVVRSSSRQASRIDHALFFIVNAALITSHLLGIVYSVTLLGALIFLDRLENRFRCRLYATVVSTWLLLLPERTAILASAQVGKPHFWTTQPNLSRWIGAYSAYSSEVGLVVTVLVCWALFSTQQKTGGWRLVLTKAFGARRSAYVVATALLLVPVELFFEGFVGPPLFINRYLLPVAIAQMFITAEAIELIDGNEMLGLLRNKLWIRAFGGTLFLAVLLSWDLWRLPSKIMLRKDYTDALTARLPRDLPVLCEDAWAFTEIIGRQHGAGVQYTYLLDWPYSVSSSAPRLEVTQYHLMENWKKAGYFAGSIVYRDMFLDQNRRFLIFHQEPGPNASYPPFIGNPLLQRFRSDPHYQVLPFGRSNGSNDQDLWLVCLTAC